MADYNATVSQAQNVAATPYSAYGGQLVAPVNAQQNTGIGAVNSASGIQNPANAAAGGLTGVSAAAINPSQVNSAAINQYESPYQSDVINATEAEIQNQNQQQAAALQGNTISSGAFGGDRAGIGQAALAGQQDIASNATLANLNNQNYSQALSEANTQQSVNLGAQQNTAARQLAAGSQFAQLGQTAQTEALNEANAQTNAGTLQQTTQQAQDTAAYNQFLQQQAYPFETTGWLANIVEGIGSQSGGSSTGQTTTTGNAGSQIAGGVLGLASFLARGGRVPHRAPGGPVTDGIYVPQVFDPTAGTPVGPGGGGIVPATVTGRLPVGHTMPTQGAPAPIAPPTPQQQAQSMSQMGNAVKGVGNAFENSSLGDQFNDAMQDAQIDAANGLTADASGVLAGGVDLGLGGIGMMARGGIVGRGIAGRRHYDDGGVVPSGDPIFDLSPESLLLNTAASPTGLAAAAQLPAPKMDAQVPPDYSNQMPAPNVAQELGSTVAAAAQLPASAVAGGLASNGFSPPLDAPLPLERPVDLGDAPIQTGGLSPSGGISLGGGPIAHAADGTPVYTNSQGVAVAPPPTGVATPSIGDQTFKRMIGIESGGQQFNPDGTVLTSPRGALGIAQIMPGTGPEAAKLAGLPWDPNRLSTDTAYNLALGKAYYQSQLAAYGSPDKAAAAYNAGPTAVDKAIAAAAKSGGSYLDYLPKETQAYVANATGGGVPALAYDGTTGRGGGIASAPVAQAIGAAAPDAGGIVAPSTQTSSPQFPDNVPTPDSGRTGLFGLNLSPETRQLMLSAGLGIMGGTSRSFLTNVGQGATQGIAAMRQNQNLSSEAALRNTQTQGAQIENQLKATQLKLMMDALNGNANSITSSASSGAPSLTTPTVTAPTVAGQTAAAPGAQSGAAPQRLNPEFDPNVLARRADVEKWVNPQAAAIDRERANQILQSGRSQDMGGNIVNLPGFVGSEAELAANKTGAESAAKSHYEMQEVTNPDGSKSLVPRSTLLQQGASGTPPIAANAPYVTEGQNQLMKEEPAITSALQNRQQVRQRMNAIAQVMQTYQTGKWAEPSAEIVANLRAAGIPISSTDTANPEAYEKFIKNQMQNVFGDVKAMGGQPRVAEIQGFQKAAAGPSLQPGSNVAILGQGLGILDSLDKHDNDFINAKYGPGGNPAMSSRLAFDQKWLADPKNQLQNFVDVETKNLSYKGQPVPKSPADAVIGQVYQTPNGDRMRWTGTGWKPAKWGAGPESRPFGAAQGGS